MVAVIDALLKTGSDVNAKTTTDEDTVLHLVIKHAVLRLAFQTCLMILEHNPDLDIRNRVRVTKPLKLDLRNQRQGKGNKTS